MTHSRALLLKNIQFVESHKNSSFWITNHSLLYSIALHASSWKN